MSWITDWMNDDEAEPTITLTDGTPVNAEIFLYVEKLLSRGCVVQVVDDETRVTIEPPVEIPDVELWLSDNVPTVAKILGQHAAGLKVH